MTHLTMACWVQAETPRWGVMGTHRHQGKDAALFIYAL